MAKARNQMIFSQTGVVKVGRFYYPIRIYTYSRHTAVKSPRMVTMQSKEGFTSKKAALANADRVFAAA